MTVAIVGAGISGLALQHFLTERGVDSVVFEAATEPGGAIDSREVDGRVLERGPQRTRRTPLVAELIDAVDLGERTIEGREGPLYVYHDGDLRRAPLSPRAALTTDLLSWRGKARVLLEPLSDPPREDESVREYLVRSFGEEFADRFAGPLYAGLYASDPAEMPARHSIATALEKHGVERSVLAAAWRALRSDRERPPVITFEDGLQALPRALTGLHEGIRFETPVRRIVPAEEGTRWAASDGRGGRYVVETPDGDWTADRVVVTTPADVASAILADLTPDSAAALDRLRYNPMAIVHLHADADLRGTGYQVAHTEDCHTMGVTWNDWLLDRDGVYTCYLGGGPDPAVLDWADDRLGRVAASEFERATGATADPIAVHRLERGMPAYDASWDALADVTLPRGIDLCTNYVARAGIPGRVRQAKGLAERIASECGDDAVARDDRNPSRTASGVNSQNRRPNARI